LLPVLALPLLLWRVVLLLSMSCLRGGVRARPALAFLSRPGNQIGVDIFRKTIAFIKEMQ